MPSTRPSLLVLALLLVGCAATPLATRTARGTMLEIDNVPEGGNCFAVRGYGREHGKICTVRLHANLDHLIGQMLDAHLPAGAGHRARLELKAVGFITADNVAFRITQRLVVYRFTLVAPSGKRLVDYIERMVEPIPATNGGVNLPFPEEMLANRELYQPGVLYQLFFDMVDRIGQAIQRSQAAR